MQSELRRILGKTIPETTSLTSKLIFSHLHPSPVCMFACARPRQANSARELHVCVCVYVLCCHPAGQQWQELKDFLLRDRATFQAQLTVLTEERARMKIERDEAVEQVRA